MARKRRSPEEIVAKLREVEALRLKGKTCGEAVRSIGVSEATYRRWRAEFGGLIRTLGPNHASVEKPRVADSPSSTNPERWRRG
jgi:transposase